MHIGLAADHAGFELKCRIADHLRAAGHEVTDFGASRLSPSDDYPDYVVPLACAVADARVERGIAVCGTGAAAAIAANKVPGARAVSVPVQEADLVGISVTQQRVNVLCLGARQMCPENACRMVEEFIQAPVTIGHPTVGCGVSADAAGQSQGDAGEPDGE